MNIPPMPSLTIDEKIMVLTALTDSMEKSIEARDRCKTLGLTADAEYWQDRYNKAVALRTRIKAY